MSFFDGVFVNTIFLLFPIFIYLIYEAYNNNIKRKKNDIVFDLLMLTSVYLLIKFSYYFPNIDYLLLVNIPLLLSYLKKRKYLGIILSIIIVSYYFEAYDFNLIYIIIEYIFYFIFYTGLTYKERISDFIINTFTFIKGIILSIEIFYLIPNNDPFCLIIIKLFILLTVFYFISYFVLYLLKKGEDIVSLNNTLKELEKEKTLRKALFKITHEIKNPIAVCKGYLDMMNYNDLIKVKKYNDIIKKEINYALTIMDDFLDYSKIKIDLDIMDIDILLEDIFTSMNSLFNSKNINAKYNLLKKDILIEGDYNRLKQAFVNILKNSVEAVNEKGKIKLTVKDKANYIELVFEDNGEGMSKETLERLGEMFYTTKVKGTGLGVSLSTEIIKLHNGKIKYESKIGEGTKVIINLLKYNETKNKKK